MSRYLVSGAAGFIGSNLVHELVQRGAEVVAVDSLRTGGRANLRGFEGKFLEADVTEVFEWEGPWDAIFHHGDITDPRHPDDSEVLRKNVLGFENMLAASARAGCRLVYASTAGLYGNGPTPMGEDQPKDLLTSYGRSKLQMDEIAMRASAETPVVGLRYFNVFGPREARKGRAASMVYHLYHQIKRGERPRLFEWGEQKRDFIYVKDVVRANLCALTAPSGVYNVGTGVATTFREIVAILGRVMGVKLEPEYFPMPYDPISYQANTLADITLAAERLGFRCEWPVEKAVADYVAWLEREGE